MQDKKVNNAFFSKNRRGQGLSVNAIILIILGLIVLVILILGFTVGWNRIFPFVQTNNVQNVATACEIACTTGSVFDYCEVEREVNDGTNPKFPATCYQLSELTDAEEAYAGRNYGIERCPAVASRCATSETQTSE